MQAYIRRTSRAPGAAESLRVAWGWHSGLLWGYYGSVGTRSPMPQQVNQQLVSVEGDGLSGSIA